MHDMPALDAPSSLGLAHDPSSNAVPKDPNIFAQVISQLGTGRGGLLHDDMPITLESIDAKHVKTWRQNELVHWVSNFKNKKFQKYSGSIVANVLDGEEISMLSQNAIIKLCHGNHIHGELMYKRVRQRLRTLNLPLEPIRRREESPERGENSDDKYDEQYDEAVNTRYARLQERNNVYRNTAMRVGRKKRCKIAVLTRDVLSYIASFERVMNDGKLSRRVAAGRSDAPISRGSYHNYLNIKQRLLELGYDLTNDDILDTPFKHLLRLNKTSNNTSSPSVVAKLAAAVSAVQHVLLPQVKPPVVPSLTVPPVMPRLSGQ
jgi:hypothetical protein